MKGKRHATKDKILPLCITDSRHCFAVQVVALASSVRLIRRCRYADTGEP